MADQKPPTRKLLTPQEKAAELQVGPAKLRELARRGVVHPIRLGHRTVRYAPGVDGIEGLAQSGGR